MIEDKPNSKILKVRMLRTEAKLLCFDAPDSYWDAPEIELAECYNGAGPDWLGETGREVATEILEDFEAEMTIHDWEFKMADGTRSGFNKANNRFWDNMQNRINKEAPIWKLWKLRKRLKMYALARIAYRSCDWFGWSAWKDV